MKTTIELTRLYLPALICLTLLVATLSPTKLVGQCGYADHTIRYAKAYLGAPYRFGGESRYGIDCSALVQKVYKKVGVRLPRVSSDQARVGKRVSLYHTRKGDLVFFRANGRSIGHVAIVTGRSGKSINILHASGQNGKVVEEVLPNWLRADYVCAKRIFTEQPREGKTIFDGLIEGIGNLFDFSIGTPEPEPPAEKKVRIKPSVPGQYPESSTELLGLVDITLLNCWQLRIMRNEIFARKGYKFNKSRKVMDHFEAQEWYQNIPKVTTQSEKIELNKLEKTNVEAIVSHEKRCNCR